jgi:hypothetical protein
MSARLVIVFAAAAALGIAAVAIGASQAAPAPVAGLDYEMFKTKVAPIFMKKRAGHSPCVVCHTGANNFLRLEELAPGQAAWNDEQLGKMYTSISRIGDAREPAREPAPDPSARARSRRRPLPFRRPPIRKQERPGLPGPDAMGRREVTEGHPRRAA